MTTDGNMGRSKDPSLSEMPYVIDNARSGGAGAGWCHLSQEVIDLMISMSV